MNRLTASEAREQLSEVLRRVAQSGERIILSEDGEDMAVLVSLEDIAEMERLEELEDERNYPSDVAAVKEAMAESDERIPYEQVRRELGLA